jgi:2-polyprenyl-6-methoxyphenol hydroxylase-like FAD-dependent oxidoreductase
MKVIIVGSGISGLSTYLFLQKYCSPITPLEISIYESHDPKRLVKPEDATFGELSSYGAIIGGGLGLSPNGMRLLRDIGTELHDTVKDSGFPVKTFVFKSSRGWRLNSSPTTDKRGHPGYPEGEEEVCVSISRHALWKALHDAVGDDKIIIKKVISATKADYTQGKKPSVTFEDGTTDEADLVIGTDGVKSVVLHSIFGEEKSVKPQYEGLIGVGGFVRDKVPQSVLDEKSMVFTFGRNGFFGYGAVSQNDAMWWSTCQADDVPANRKLSPTEMKKQLVERHGSWNDPNIQDIIETSDVSQIYPVWTTPLLPHWGVDGLLVVGDAAHALQPTSGQGSSQALEDARCLSLLLSKFLSEHLAKPEKLSLQQAIELSIKAQYEVRSPRIKRIVDRTKMMADRKREQTVVEEMTLCFFLWFIGKVPSAGKMLIGDVNQELYYWDMDGLVDEAVKKQLDTLA